jgi:hypothetical protein
MKSVGGQPVNQRRVRAVIILIGEAVLAFAVWRQVTNAGPAYRVTSDVGRYFEIVTHRGTPYRDYPVEYPPGAFFLFRLLGRASFAAFVRHLLLLNFACEAIIVALCYRGWGPRVAWSYLLLSTPLLVIVYPRFDLVALVVAVAGAYLLSRKRAVSAGLLWIVAALIKPWPLALVPGLAARRQMRAFIVAMVAGGCSLAAWLVWGGISGPRQVLTFRNAKGWEAESVPGSLLRVVTRDPVRFENGTWRLGAPPAVFTLLLVVGILVVVGYTWWYAARHEVVDGVAEIVAITATLAFATLLSPQFVLWMLPWVAIAAAAGAPRLERFAGVVVALTLLSFAAFDVNHPGRLISELADLARNAALVALLVASVVELRRGAPLNSKATSRSANASL